MLKLIALLKAAMSQDMTLFKTKTKNESKTRKMILPIFLSLLVMFSVGTYAALIAEELTKVNLTYIMLTIFVILTSFLTLIEGIYKSQGILFDARDNNLLFSLPISKANILFVRIFKLTAFQILYNSLFMIPAIAVYAVFEMPSISFYVISFIALLVLPIIPTIVGCIIGYIIKGVTSKFKSRNIMQVVFTSAMLLAIFYGSFNTQGLIENIVYKANSINEVITGLYYPAGLYVNLMQNFNILDLIVLIAINIIPAVIFIFLASVTYFKIISRLTEKGSKSARTNSKIKKSEIKVRSKLMALINKEIKRFFSSPVFIINAGFGDVLIVAVTIAISFNFDGFVGGILQQKEIGMSLEQIKALMPKIFYGFVVFTSCMISITSSMISIEGKSFNITKSLPVSTKKILLAKVLTSCILSIPVILISDVIFFISFKVEIIDILFILLASIIVPTFTALVGILMNLKYPKMDATSDTEVVKQSMSSAVSVFIGIFMGIISIAFIAYGSTININMFVILELLIFTIINAALWAVLNKYGVRKFIKISG